MGVAFPSRKKGKNMENCRVCGEKKELKLIKAKELFVGTRKSYDYLLCSSCNSLSLSSRIQQLEEVYAKYPPFEYQSVHMNYWKKFVYETAIFGNSMLSPFFQKFLSTWEDLSIKSLHNAGLKKSNRILDVGCGSGRLVQKLKELGFTDVTGMDPYLKSPKSEDGLKLIRSKLEEVEEQFDFIMCHHSFEHFECPHTAIKEFKRIMCPGGTLLIRIPNIESYSFKKFKSSWHGIHPPFHFFLPSRSGMQTLFSDSGFQIKEVRQEQIVELFLYNINLCLDIAMTEPLGVVSFLGNNKLKKPPPTFSNSEIKFWKDKVKTVKRDNMADYVAYYLRFNDFNSDE